jgi:hypothetical protein
LPLLEIGRLDPPHAVVVQSSELVNFRVNKDVLAMSSRFFARMFSHPKFADNEAIGGLPVVRLSEDAETVNRLLTMLYPVHSVVPTAYDKALEVLAAAQKYEMAGIQSRIRTEIKSWGPIVSTGLMAYRAYAISSSAKLLPEMETSARHTLNFPMTLEYLSAELPLFEGWALRDLVRYRKRCRDCLVLTLQVFLATPSNIWVVCTSTTQRDHGERDLSSAIFPEWLQDMFSQYIKKLQETFTDPLLKPSSIHDAYLAMLNSHVDLTNCNSCLMVHTLKGRLFCEVLERKLAQALDKVSALM